MATSGAGTGRALRGFDLKLPAPRPGANAPKPGANAPRPGASAPRPGASARPHVPLTSGSQASLVFSLWGSAGMKRPDGLGKDEDDDASGLKEAAGRVLFLLVVIGVKIGGTLGGRRPPICDPSSTQQLVCVLVRDGGSRLASFTH